ncbi:MAG: DUF4173 domain-containing protein [Pseudomonadota bacterium]
MTALVLPQHPKPFWAHVRSYRFCALIALVWLADWLFFERTPGLSVAVFAVALAALALAMVQHGPSVTRVSWAGAALGAGLVPSLQVVNPLTFSIAMAGAIAFVLLVNRRLSSGLLAGLTVGLCFVAHLPGRFVIDLARYRKRPTRPKRTATATSRVRGWVVPVSFSLLFAGLFAAANPMFERWLGHLGSLSDASVFDLQRWGVWLLACLVCWPFLRLRGCKLPSDLVKDLRAMEPRLDGPRVTALISEPAVFRSLLLFNLLFALQNGLDATYLWGGVTLPDGMTYAGYAHRGAYTLIGTALLAAGFVLFTTRQGAPAEHSLRARWLLLLWTAQNALLVQYCVLRLNLYVDVYALTYWRVAAFAWMGLVFAGLVLIFAKFAWDRSAKWLVEANLICAMLVLYGIANLNLPELIANHNVRVSEPGEKTKVVDPVYLAALGPAALPAIDTVLAAPDAYTLDHSTRSEISALALLKLKRAQLVHQVRIQATDWRGWGWRHARTRAYLNKRHAPSQMLPWRVSPH